MEKEDVIQDLKRIYFHNDGNSDAHEKTKNEPFGQKEAEANIFQPIYPDKEIIKICDVYGFVLLGKEDHFFEPALNLN